MYGGLAWNKSSSLEILNVDILQQQMSTSLEFNIVENFGHHIRQVLSYLLFPSKDSMSSVSNNSLQAAVALILDIFTGNTKSLLENHENSANTPSHASFVPSSINVVSFFFSYGGANSQSTVLPTQSEIDINDSGMDNKNTSSSVLYLTELKLWPLITSSSYLNYGAVPSKSECARCLRVYRRIINTANWKPNHGVKASEDLENGNTNTNHIEHFQFPIEIEEYLTIIYILSILCRAIILAYNFHEKSVKSVAVSSDTFARLVKLLPPGTKSDIANSLLESIEHCSIIWKKKYDKIQFRKPQYIIDRSVSGQLVHNWIAGTSHTSNDRSNSSSNDIDESFRVLTYIRGKFLLQPNIGIPLSPLFQVITSELDMPKSMDDVLKHLFE